MPVLVLASFPAPPLWNEKLNLYVQRKYTRLSMRVHFAFREPGNEAILVLV